MIFVEDIWHYTLLLDINLMCNDDEEKLGNYE